MAGNNLAEYRMEEKKVEITQDGVKQNGVTR